MTGLIKFEFEGKPLAAYRFRERSCMVAQHVGLGLDYTPKGFRQSLSQWSDEMIAGHDFDVLRGDDLKAFLASADASPNLGLK